MKDLNSVKMAILPNMIYRFDRIPIKIPADSFVESYKQILNFTWKFKKCRIVKIMLKKKRKLEESHFLISKLTTKLQYNR